MKYLKNIKNYKDLKEKYRNAIKANHPDNGGNLEAMQEVNAEYEILFRIWKDKAEKAGNLDEEEKAETAKSTRRHFYTANGWEGSRYDSNLTLKEIAKIVRGYVKEKYPTTKWSIRTHYASMCQSLSVDLLEFPEKMWYTAEDLANYAHMERRATYNGKEFDTFTDEAQQLFRKLSANGFLSDSWSCEDFRGAYAKAMEQSPSFYGLETEYFSAVIADVNAFIASYNYDDSDIMTDYFDVNFYGGKVDASHCKQVEKVARIKNQDNRPTATATERKQAEPEQLETSGKPYTIEERTHTKTGATIYCVKWLETLDRNEYLALNAKIKSIGGYYSKFTHSFVFSEEPSAKLAQIA